MKSRQPVAAIGLAFLLCLAACGGGGGSNSAADAVTSATPASGATDVPVTQAVTIAFSAQLDATTCTSANITLTRAGGAVNVPGTIDCTTNPQQMTFTPTYPLAAGALHTLTIANSVHTKAAAGAYALTFTTAAAPMLFIFSETNAAAANIFSMNTDGTHQANLSAFTDKATATAKYYAAWSPDMTRVAFVGSKGGGNDDPSDLYIVNADGAGLTKLTSGTGNYKVDGLKWAPDGSRIFFSFMRDSLDDATRDIASIAPDGSGYLNITSGSGATTVTGQFFEISPDGGQIYYLAGTPGTTPRNIYSIASTGGTPTQISDVGAGNMAGYLTISPDGTRIYYMAGTGTAFGLYSIGADGSNPQTLAAAAANQQPMPWSVSPDGRQLLATLVTLPGPIFNLYIYNADGSDPIPIATASGSDGGATGCWSPDGTRIAYLYGNADTGPVNIYVANRDGTGAASITSYTGDTMAYDGQLWLLKPSLGAGLWSPDGTQIAFTRMIKSTSEYNVMIANTDGSGVTALTTSAPPATAALVGWWY